MLTGRGLSQLVEERNARILNLCGQLQRNLQICSLEFLSRNVDLGLTFSTPLAVSTAWDSSFFSPLATSEVPNSVASFFAAFGPDVKAVRLNHDVPWVDNFCLPLGSPLKTISDLTINFPNLERVDFKITCQGCPPSGQKTLEYLRVIQTYCENPCTLRARVVCSDFFDVLYYNLSPEARLSSCPLYRRVFDGSEVIRRM